jgi:hypothetical protein
MVSNDEIALPRVQVQIGDDIGDISAVASHIETLRNEPPAAPKKRKLMTTNLPSRTPAPEKK